jgi:hypothetical protein
MGEQIHHGTSGARSSSSASRHFVSRASLLNFRWVFQKGIRVSNSNFRWVFQNVILITFIKTGNSLIEFPQSFAHLSHECQVYKVWI